MRTRDRHRHSPLFVLAPARSNSTVVATMIGRHPELYGFPELALFRRRTLKELISDPPGWRGTPGRLRMVGTIRALAELHDGEQTKQTIEAAAKFIIDRPAWTGPDLYDHLLDLVAPRIGVEKSPENSGRADYLEYLVHSYPNAKFLHLTRHPVPTVHSMNRVWSGRGFWDMPEHGMHQFCLGVWQSHHARLHRLVTHLGPKRALRVRSEDLLDPEKGPRAFGRIARWIGIDAGPQAIDAMRHPETSPFASIGPSNALGGGDSGFLRDPVVRAHETPPTLDFPRDWVLDPWSQLGARRLAKALGYS